MNAQELLDAIGMIDDECIQNAKPTLKSSKRILITIVSMAACLAFMIWVPKMLTMEDYLPSTTPTRLPSSAAVQNSVAVVTERDVPIYYVDGDTISSVEITISIPYKAQDAFAAWKEKNGIGDEVTLIEYREENNGITSATFELNGVELTRYTLPTYHALYITVSKNIENYYDRIDSVLLLESLEKTMRALHNTEYDESHITFE